MKVEVEGEHKELSALTNRQLVELTVRRENVTRLEIELAMRLESFLDIHGDYMTEL